jgi:hypothetical protein
MELRSNQDSPLPHRQIRCVLLSHLCNIAKACDFVDNFRDDEHRDIGILTNTFYNDVWRSEGTEAR